MTNILDDLNSDDPDILQAAIDAASDSNDDRIIRRLCELTVDLNISDRTRTAAAVALAQSGPDEGRQHLLALLQDEDQVHRTVAAGGLAGWQTAESMNALIDALEDHTNTVRNVAERSLLQMMDTVREHGIDRLVGLLSHSIPLTRSPAARLLGQSQDARALAPLLDRVRNDSDWLGRMWAVRALGDLGDVDAFGLLADVCSKDEKNRVRAAAAEAIGLLRAPESETILKTALNDDDEGVKKAATEALEALGLSGIDDESDPFADD